MTCRWRDLHVGAQGQLGVHSLLLGIGTGENADAAPKRQRQSYDHRDLTHGRRSFRCGCRRVAAYLAEEAGQRANEPPGGAAEECARKANQQKG